MQTTKVLNPKKIQVVEYSHRQRCFHINTLEMSIEQNLRSHILGTSHDYKIYGVAETYDEALELSKELEKLGFVCP